MSNFEIGTRDDDAEMPALQAAYSVLTALLDAIQTNRLSIVEDSEFHLEAVEARVLVAVAALETADDTKCTLDRKPPVATKVRPTGPDGNLIRRCEHDPSHCWRLDGTRLDCP